MTIQQNNDRHGKRVAKLIPDAPSGDGSVLSGVWSWINGVANGVSHFIGTTLLNGLKVTLQHLENLAAAIGDVLQVMRRIIFWVDILVWHVVRGWIAKERARARAEDQRLARWLVGLIYVTTQTVLTLALRATHAEKVARIRAVSGAEADAKARIRALHGVIEREASSGYSTDREQRVSVIVRLLDFAALRVPELHAAVNDIASGLLDLLAIDDPLLRIALGFLVKQVIDRLGIDKAVGTLIGDLMAPILGKPEPRNVHDTILDICQRLDAIEEWQATFTEDGGSQILQAGEAWRDITSVVGNIAIAAFVAQAVVSPDAWAAEISGTIGAAANDVAARAAQLFGG